MTNRPALRHATPRRGPAAGFTLVEVLVAVVILSFGLLGVVGLQVASLQANREARLQSSAVRLGRELADLMRGNKDIALAPVGNPYEIDFTGTLPTTTADCFTAACASSTAVAQFQLRDWLTRVDAEMPGARALICFDSAPYAASGQPRWACTGPSTNNALTNTVPLVVKLGWTRASTDRKATGANALVAATDPTVVLPLLAGSAE